LHYEKFADGSVKCIEDEIPFELPDGWAWTRLGNLSAAIQYGLSNSAESQGTYRLLRITDIQDGKVDWDTVPFTTTDAPDTYLLKSGDIVFARTGATVGKSFLITETPYPSVYASYLIRIRLLGNLSSEYIYQFFDSACYWSQITDKSVGVGQPNCNGTSLKELFIPLPPINEQLKIVPTVQELLKYVATINADRKELLSIIDNAKAKILDLAIRGQLVPQNPDDEPASVLLERIRAEKEELIKQGKIKRDKKESIIFKGEDNSYYEKINGNTRCIDSELPFDLPESWTFVRLKQLGEVIGGGTPKTNISEYWDGDIPWVTPADFSGYEGMYISAGTRTITEIGLNSSSAQMLPKNAVLYSSRAPIGYIAIAANPISTNQGFKSIVPYDFAMSNYLYYCLKARTSDIIQRATGTTFKEISGSEMAETIIPLPPINEQNRIFEKATQLFAVLKSIEKSLS
jgi:type I restriction enzyme S subunit